MLATKRLDPILRWAGSKRKLVPALLSAAPTSYSRYYEPFAGSACFFLALAPRRATISDTNDDLMSAYRVISRKSGEVSSLLDEMPVSKPDYYRIRELSHDGMSDVQKTAAFIYLNRNCFNGIYRENRQGRFNVPFGSRVGKMPDSNQLRMVGKRMYRTRLMTADFEVALKSASVNDFVYLDPPYITTNRASYGEYGYGTYRDEEIGRLIEVLKELDDRKVKILISYKDDQALTNALDSWSVKKLSVLRTVASKQSDRIKTQEILASNYSNLNKIDFGAYGK
ncbi:MAG: Dam family site-specific DNA-(adenine-N6)-methyltransferase [Rhodococcus sp.]|nr:Dam family site-specific DNA-(adenine-N6)-methyltransferase [Rhodococcus sp. (in: high G+C Gram-positive bacteria)]